MLFAAKKYSKIPVAARAQTVFAFNQKSVVNQRFNLCRGIARLVDIARIAALVIVQNMDFA